MGSIPGKSGLDKPRPIRALLCPYGRLLLAESGLSISPYFHDLNVRFGEKQTFRVQAIITVKLSAGERPVCPRKRTLS